MIGGLEEFGFLKAEDVNVVPLHKGTQIVDIVDEATAIPLHNGNVVGQLRVVHMRRVWKIVSFSSGFSSVATVVIPPI